MLDANTLKAERRRLFLATRGGVVVSLAGVAFWGLLGAAGFHWSARTWCLVVLWAGAAAVPVGVFLLSRLVSRLALESPLSTVILPAMLPVGLSLGVAAAVFPSDASLVPLILVFGFSLHWPVVGWIFDTRIHSVHAVVRVGVGVGVWLLFPESRFTWLPLATSAVYAGTALWILERLRRLK